MLTDSEMIKIQRNQIAELWQAINELRGKILSTTEKKISELSFAEVIMNLSDLRLNDKFRRVGWGAKLYATLESNILELRVEWDSGKDCAYVPTNEDIFANDWYMVEE